MLRPPPRSTRTDTLFPYTTLFRSPLGVGRDQGSAYAGLGRLCPRPSRWLFVLLSRRAALADQSTVADRGGNRLSAHRRRLQGHARLSASDPGLGAVGMRLYSGRRADRRGQDRIADATE